MQSVAFPIHSCAGTVVAGSRLAVIRQAMNVSGAPVMTPWPDDRSMRARRLPVDKGVENPEPDSRKPPKIRIRSLTQDMDADRAILAQDHFRAPRTTDCVAIAFLLVAVTCNWRHQKMYIHLCIWSPMFSINDFLAVANDAFCLESYSIPSALCAGELIYQAILDIAA